MRPSRPRGRGWWWCGTTRSTSCPTSCTCSRSCSAIPKRRPRSSCSTCTTRARRPSRRGTGSRPRPMSPGSTPTVCGPRWNATEPSVMAPRAPFRRNRTDGFDVVLEAGEAAVLTRLCEEMTTLLSVDDGEAEAADPVLERLFPRAYLDPTEEEAESDWQRLVHGDLLDGRRQALATVESGLAAAHPRRGRFE